MTAQFCAIYLLLLMGCVMAVLCMCQHAPLRCCVLVPLQVCDTCHKSHICGIILYTHMKISVQIEPAEVRLAQGLLCLLGDVHECQ